MVGDTDNVPETLLCKFASATPEHFLCRVIGLDDPIVLVEQQNGEDQRRELRTRIGCAGDRVHAARRRRNGS